jgi:hypothetical protein
MIAVHAQAEPSPKTTAQSSSAAPAPSAKTAGAETGAPAPRTAPPALSPSGTSAVDPSLNKTLDQIRALPVEPVKAVPPSFEEDGAAAPAPASAETDTAAPADEEDPDKKIVTKEGPNGKITYVERSEDSMLAVELVLDDKVTIFDPALPIYQVNETVLVPLGRFAADVGFPIKVDTSRATADGWFLKPENTFHFSSPYKFVEIAGKKVPVHQPGIAETHIDDIYVSLDLLNSWFPIGLTLNYHELRLYMKTLTDLPVQERAKRHGRWETSKSDQKQPGLQYNPKDVIKLPYRMYSAPAIQMTHGYTHAMTAAGSSSTSSTSLNATTDLLGMSARGSVAFATATEGTEQIQGISFNLAKEDYDGKLLGKLHATRYELGDISMTSFPLAGGGSGRGFNVTNQPYNFVSDASQFHISGFATAGWDVEIFQGSELLAFAQAGPDGRYDFPTLPLKQGFNLFRTVLYGPNGEKEERFQRFYLGQDMVPKGKLYYNASALESSSPLLDVSAVPAEATAPSMSLSGEYGFSKDISALAGYFHGPTGKTVLDGVGFGLRGSSTAVYTQMNVFLDKSGGETTSSLVAGNINETTSFNVRDQLHLGWDPGVYPTERSSAVQLTKMFDFKKDIIPTINLTLSAGRDKEENDRIKRPYIARIATNFMGLAISNDMEYDTFSDATPDSYTGDLSARIRTPAGTLHTEWTYNFFQPFLRWKTGSIDLQKDLTDKLTLTTRLNHSFAAVPVTAISATLDWKLKKVHLGLTG